MSTVPDMPPQGTHAYHLQHTISACRSQARICGMRGIWRRMCRWWKWRRSCRIQDEHLRAEAERQPHCRRLAAEELAKIKKPAPLPFVPGTEPRRPEPKIRRAREPQPHLGGGDLLWEPIDFE